MHRKLAFGSSITGLFVLGACATTNPPPELVGAREEYQRVQSGPTAKVAPTELYEAQKALDRANKAFADDRSDQEVRDYAYVAKRKAQTAEAQARIYIADRSKQKYEKEQYEQTAAALGRTKEQLEKTTKQVEAERSARLEAEKRADDALASLEKFASVKKEDRGTVITLTGSVLFGSGSSTLLTNAYPKLDEVANALKEEERARFIVEGHTDSRGSDSFNQELSLRRAQAVRDYLIQRGVPSEQLEAVGRGKERPVADNSTAEGRANNRRVEIVVQREATPSSG